MLKEFKEFATKGNIMDLAIGVIIGGAFQKVVNSLVNDLIMPLIALLTGKVDYTSWVITIHDTTISVGSFLTNIINFIIIAFSIFLVVRYINKLNKKLEEVKENELKKINKKLHTDKLFKKFRKKKKEEKPIPTSKICPYCFSKINIKASRCPNCTSILEENKKEETTIENQIKIEE